MVATASAFAGGRAHVVEPWDGLLPATEVTDP
jgi:hypothetical protein